MQTEQITVGQAAERQGLSRWRILAYIKDGRLPSVKVGRFNLINPADLDKIELKPVGNHSGRPRTKKPQK